MLCEQANAQLIEYATQELPPGQQAAVEQHLSGCATCQEDYTAIAQWRTMASNWHDEIVPAWKPAPILHQRGPHHGWIGERMGDWMETFRQWFPTAASTAALAMVTLILVQAPQTVGILPTGQPATTSFEALPPLPQAQQAAMVQSVIDGSREQRQNELQALLKILKSEMDRRSVETEESLRYVISHQLQGQEELDELYRQVEVIMLDPEQAARPAPAPGDINP